MYEQLRGGGGKGPAIKEKRTFYINTGFTNILAFTFHLRGQTNAIFLYVPITHRHISQELF